MKRSFRVREKSFLFLGEKAGEYNVMLTLDGPALDQARSLAAGREGLDIGSAGWVTLRFAPSEEPKKLIALLDAR